MPYSSATTASSSPARTSERASSSRAPPCREDRLSEGAAHVGDQLCVLEAGKRKRGGEPVGAEHDALQVARGHFREDELPVAHHDELADGVCFVAGGLAGVV